MTSSICPRQSPPSLSWMRRGRPCDPEGTRSTPGVRDAQPGSRPRTFRLTSGIQRTRHPAFQNASQTPHGSRLRVIGLTANPEGPSPGVRQASDLLRTLSRRSTATRWNSEEIRRATSLRFQALVEPINRPQKRIKAPKNSSPLQGPSELRGTRRRTVNSPHDSEEPMSERHVRIRAPENPAPNL